ncbi:hypothetical protein [Aureibacter tunicatorum]|uniref:DUF1700 domain-containing protein n=1 Tax=Aureibacter tunicatorum TaxID=866807 RepID=A0AAE3XIE2_9BACT|nr:hypothetical protein [Aureibacter tunicatorum]MDR6237362.1 hypothetical protein [Aureibacter tunicatorum]BDD06353.1 hypothetical protein AUTU_38360 [Aureibacter tunicatorum]
MKRITFKNKATQKIYDKYFKECGKEARNLTNEDRQDIIMELNSHIYEALQGDLAIEPAKFQDIIDNLGTAKTVIRPLVADKKMDQALKTFNPIQLAKALVLNITNGISYVIFAIIYLIILSGIYAIYIKIAHPEEVGMFFCDGKFMVFGRVQSEALQSKYVEVLGHGMIPFTIMIMAIAYFLLIFIMKSKRKLKNHLS